MSTFKILICGLPGTGKTTLAKAMVEKLKAKGKTVAWYNADSIREAFNDWDFSPEGRIRQATRMRDSADSSLTDYTICDFVAPTDDIRNIFKADYVIWMDTEKTSPYEDTNKIFERPRFVNFIISTKDADFISDLVIRSIDLL